MSGTHHSSGNSSPGNSISSSLSPENDSNEKQNPALTRGAKIRAKEKISQIAKNLLENISSSSSDDSNM